VGEKQRREPPLPIRLPPGMKQRLTDAAERQGVSVNALAVRSLERTLGIQHEDDVLPPEAHSCRHPKDQEKPVMSGKSLMMVRCGACGARLR
jgi:hypothetical protein